MLTMISFIAWLYAHQITAVAIIIAFLLGAVLNTLLTRGWRGFVATWLN